MQWHCLDHHQKPPHFLQFTFGNVS